MKNMKNKIKIYFLIGFITIPFEIYSSEFKDNSRNRMILYTNLLNIDQYESFSTRKRQETQNITFLYGITNNYFIGFNYNRGKNPESYAFGLPILINNSFRINEYKKSREGEYITFKNQYFFWYDFYLSINFGIEKSFREINNKYIVGSDRIDLEPISIRTNYSDRAFGTLGLGYRLEFFTNFIFGFEFEYGAIQSSKQNKNISFNPEFYGGIPPELIIERLLFFERISDISNFSFISIYFGVSF